MLPIIPQEDGRDLPVIQRGHAEAALLEAFAHLAQATKRCEAIAHALARALDEKGAVR